MLRVSLLTIRHNRGRYGTTVLAVVLGVTFIAGTLVFGDTMESTHESQVMGSAGSLSAVVHPADDGEQTDEEPLDPELLPRVDRLPEVEGAGGMVTDYASVLDQEGRPMDGIPPAAIAVDDVTRFDAAEGRLPEADDEIALSTTTAEYADFSVGDTVTVVNPEGDTRDLSLIGLVDFGSEAQYAASGAAVYTEDIMRALTGATGYDEIAVLAAEGSTDDEVVEAVEAVSGDTTLVRTGEEFGEALAEEAGADAQLVQVALLLFGVVSVVVAGIVIYNTFAILIAQRQRELALMRCAGAHRGQVFRSVLAEATVVGLVASALGTATGIGAGIAAVTLAGPALGTETADQVVRVGVAPIVVGVVLGTLMTVVSAFLPALRATRVAPVEALRSSATAAGIAGRPGPARPLVGGALFAVSAVMVVQALRMPTGPLPLTLVVLAGIVAFSAVAVNGPLIVRVAARAAGWVLRPTGISGALAADNTRRSPRRAATAMIALTVGATLITGYSVISSSLDATVSKQLGERFPVDYQISAQPTPDEAETDAGGSGVSDQVYEKLAATPEVSTLYADRRDVVESDGAPLSVVAFLDAELGRDVTFELVEGDLDQLGHGDIAIPESHADGRGVGDPYTLDTEVGERELEIVAIVDDGEQMGGGAVMHPDDFAAALPDSPERSAVYVTGVPEASGAELRDAVHSAVDDEPLLQVTSLAQLKQEIQEILGIALLVIVGMLGLALVIALIGIANTLALSVLERTRESALLRALGLPRSGLRRMLAAEATLLAAVGTTTGVLLGLVFGWAAGSAVLPNLVFHVPYAQIAGFLAAGLAAGLLASVLPGRRAARASITGALGSG